MTGLRLDLFGLFSGLEAASQILLIGLLIVLLASGVLLVVLGIVGLARDLRKLFDSENHQPHRSTGRR
jgi:hypothetical protein